MCPLVMTIFMTFLTRVFRKALDHAFANLNAHDCAAHLGYVDRDMTQPKKVEGWKIWYMPDYDNLQRMSLPADRAMSSSHGFLARTSSTCVC